MAINVQVYTVLLFRFAKGNPDFLFLEKTAVPGEISKLRALGRTLFDNQTVENSVEREIVSLVEKVERAYPFLENGETPEGFVETFLHVSEKEVCDSSDLSTDRNIKLFRGAEFNFGVPSVRPFFHSLKAYAATSDNMSATTIGSKMPWLKEEAFEEGQFRCISSLLETLECN